MTNRFLSTSYFKAGRTRQLVEYIVEPENELCTRCNTYGHSREMRSCPLYSTCNNYCCPGLKRRCSRCNEAGHTRNSSSCSLFQQFTNEYARDILRIKRQNHQYNLRDRDEKRKIGIIIDTLKQRNDLMIHIRNSIELSSYDEEFYDFENEIREVNRVFSQLHYLESKFDIIVNPRDTDLTQLTTDCLENLEDDIISIINNLNYEMTNYLSDELVFYSHYPGQRIHRTLSRVYNEQQNTQDGSYVSIMKPYVNIIKSNTIDLTDNTPECSICFENTSFNDICKTNCNHMFCTVCIQGYHKSRISLPDMPCPLCRTNVITVNTTSDKLKF